MTGLRGKGDFMQRPCFVLFIWFALAMVLLQTADTLIPLASSLPHPSTFTFSFVYSRPGSHSSCCETTVSASKELGRRCASQNKQGFAPGRAVPLPSGGMRQRDGHLHAGASVSPVVPVHFFFPRNLSPPAADDDPFLS